jgi:hypothetical protein
MASTGGNRSFFAKEPVRIEMLNGLKLRHARLVIQRRGSLPQSGKQMTRVTGVPSTRPGLSASVRRPTLEARGKWFEDLLTLASLLISVTRLVAKLSQVTSQ